MYELEVSVAARMARVIHAADLPQDRPSNSWAPGWLARG